MKIKFNKSLKGVMKKEYDSVPLNTSRNVEGLVFAYFNEIKLFHILDAWHNIYFHLRERICNVKYNLLDISGEE